MFLLYVERDEYIEYLFLKEFRGLVYWLGCNFFSRVLFARIWPAFLMAPACGISLADVYAAQRGHEIIVFVSSCCFIN